ncbi:thiamine pyrophosphate-binding protein [Eubacterium pyruvativorans]|uniref:thiamine pyrophosphate-binding protein n=1 Tax=Eubacterium pyruvativorans TaxID=155865 RepID=UPI000E820280|nr:thiamine pyrophosphate-binding protein [Eubacterium pyruvativorans]HAT82789.1 thiamine pyrophosphate-binding protein [Eubacterium sp.]MCI5746548.1 thiamine pyrophosphate-binding protein [Eubacterium pyruvativorans]MDD6708074.1 thiamine pyrophosphate-binding protein [Eubacterium pyruvativorans]MDD7684066.1 thiamine pyrophosphate-binding protein [Eubacterium pyruvativorans]MDY4050132.1 thiamine pyrophosphate-binding protein [Eubacterium pyruvativorans]
MKTSDYIAEFLADHGIRHCYGYQGTMIAHLVDSLCRHPRLTNHVCLNEQGAAFAAVGEAKVTGRCAFAYSTSGPGAANLLNGVADAYYDSVPVLFITGQLNSYEYYDLPELKQHGFQEMDVVDMAKPVTKYCVQVRNAHDLPRILHEAYETAVSGRPGPVLIDLPMDMQRMEIDPEDYCFASSSGQAEPVFEMTPEACADEILEALRAAKRPVLAVGKGIDPALRKTLRELVRTLEIPTVTSMPARDLLEYDDPLNFGHMGSGYGHRAVNMIVNKKTDLIVALGVSLCKRQTGMKTENFARDAQIIRVDIDPTELSRRIHEHEKSYLQDASDVMTALAAKAEGAVTDPAWLAVCRRIREELTAFDDSRPEREPNQITKLISEYTKDAKTVCLDVGQHMMWGSQSYALRGDQRMICSGGHGAMGFSLPAAIGAAISTGGPVITLTGDGSMQMNIQELEWMHREQLPITVFVMNNHSLGLIQQQQDSIFQGRYYSSVAEGGYTAPDFAKVAAAYGIHSARAENREELEQILKDLDLGKPNVIDVQLDVHSRAYPKTSFGEEMQNQQPYMPAELMKELLAL